MLIKGETNFMNILLGNEEATINPRNLFCICFGYVPKSSNSGVSCFCY